MSDPSVSTDDELEQAPEPDESGEGHGPAAPPSFAQIVEALGLPADARAVVITPTSAVAIATDYPEPHTMPESEEAHDGD